MATEVVMPKLGLTMERGTIGAWLKAEGDTVRRGEPLLEIVTDKVTMEVEAQAGGVLRRILVAEGEEVDVATPIGVIGEPGEDISGLAGPPAAAASRSAAAGPAAPPARVAEPSAADVAADRERAPASDGRPYRASPKARRMAAAHDLDWRDLPGSGPGGRVVSADVEARLKTAGAGGDATGPAAVAEGAPVALTPAQRVAAQRLTASYQQAPHIFLEMAVRATWLRQFRDGFAAEGRRVSYNDLILKAVAGALREHPRLNAHYRDGQVHQLPGVDIGIATDTERGLLVPVLRGVDQLDVEQIATESQRLIAAARSGRLGPDELAGGSFTVSNLGMFGVARFTAIINPPQVAILAVAAIEPRVVAVEADAMAVRPMLNVTLSADHRAVDGAMAARFLQRLKQVLESPGLLT